MTGSGTFSTAHSVFTCPIIVPYACTRRALEMQVTAAVPYVFDNHTLFRLGDFIDEPGKWPFCRRRPSGCGTRSSAPRRSTGK